MSYDIGSTIMLELRNKFSNLDKYENRMENYGAQRLFEKQSVDPMGIITPDLVRNVASTFNRAVKELVVNDASSAVVSSSSYTCAPCVYGTAESALVTISPVIYQKCITTSPKDFENDAYAKNFEALMFAVENEFLKDFEADAIAALEAAKNQFWTSVAPDFSAQVGDALQVPNAEWDFFYNNADAIMMAMYFNTMNQGSLVDVLMNPQHKPLWNQYFNQSTGNAVNTAFQFGNFSQFFSNQLTNGGGVSSTNFLVKEGSVGVVDRHHYNATQRLRITESDRWEMAVLPRTGLPVALHYQRTCEDLSTGGNGTAKDSASMVDSWTFSIERAWLTCYNSDITTRYQPIVKSEFLP